MHFCHILSTICYANVLQSVKRYRSGWLKYHFQIQVTSLISVSTFSDQKSNQIHDRISFTFTLKWKHERAVGALIPVHFGNHFRQYRVIRNGIEKSYESLRLYINTTKYSWYNKSNVLFEMVLTLLNILMIWVWTNVVKFCWHVVRAAKQCLKIGEHVFDYAASLPKRE